MLQAILFAGCMLLLTSPLAAASDYLIQIMRLSDQRLEQRLNQQFSKDLSGLEHSMRGEIERSMGPYAGITNERLVAFVNLMIKRKQLEEASSCEETSSQECTDLF